MWHVQVFVRFTQNSALSIWIGSLHHTFSLSALLKRKLNGINSQSAELIVNLQILQ